MKDRNKRRLFSELFLMMLIVMVLTTMMFLMNGRAEAFYKTNIMLTLGRMAIIIAAALALSYFEAVNISRTVRVLRAAFRKIRHSDLRERIYLDEDNLFSEISGDVNAFLDNIDEKLKYIRDGLEQIKRAAENGSDASAGEKADELLSMFCDNEKKPG